MRIIRAFTIITVRFEWTAPFVADSGGQLASHFSSLLLFDITSTDRWRVKPENPKYVRTYVYSKSCDRKTLY